jgi:hypothetical protein
MKKLSLVILFICLAVFYLLFFTTAGNKFIFKAAIAIFAKAERVEFQSFKGSILTKIRVGNLRVEGLRGLPKDSRVDIQTIEIGLDIRKFIPVVIKVFNGRLSVPDLGLILFNGDYTGGLLELNIYAKELSISSLFSSVNLNKPLAKVKGTLEDVDFSLRGPLGKLVFEGGAVFKSLVYGEFSLKETPFSCDFNFTEYDKAVGSLVLIQGEVSGQSTALIYLERSRIVFPQGLKNPELDINGFASVGGVKINLFLKGTLDAPDLRLSSIPPLPQERLLVMLITGKEWSGADAVIKNGGISPDLAMDFIDYFLLGSEGGKLARDLGITDFSITMDKDARGVAVKKSVHEKAELGYGILQEEDEREAQDITHKISGEVKVTDCVSVAAEKEIKQVSSVQGSEEAQKPDDRVMIKFKNTF